MSLLPFFTPESPEPRWRCAPARHALGAARGILVRQQAMSRRRVTAATPRIVTAEMAAASAAPAPSKTVKLNTGYEMPLIGLG